MIFSKESFFVCDGLLFWRSRVALKTGGILTVKTRHKKSFRVWQASFETSLRRGISFSNDLILADSFLFGG
jgi:hypothetical protein